MFWFALGGPAAALFYRLAVLSPHDDNEQETASLAHWLEWPAMQLLGFSYALVGDFAACHRKWREDMSGIGADYGDRLLRLALAAQGGASVLACQSHSAGDATIAAGEAQIRELMAMQRRCLVLWLVFGSIAILLFMT